MERAKPAKASEDKEMDIAVSAQYAVDEREEEGEENTVIAYRRKCDILGDDLSDCSLVSQWIDSDVDEEMEMNEVEKNGEEDEEREIVIHDQVNDDRKDLDRKMFYNFLRRTPRPLDDPAARYFIDSAADPSDSELDMDDPKMRREYVDCLKKPLRLPMEEDDVEYCMKQIGFFFQLGLNELRRYDGVKHVEVVAFNCLKLRPMNRDCYRPASSATPALDAAIGGVLRNVMMHSMKLPMDNVEWDNHMAEVMSYIRTVNITLRSIGVIYPMKLNLKATYFLRPTYRPSDDLAAAAVVAAAPAGSDPAQSEIVATESEGLREIKMQLAAIKAAADAANAKANAAVASVTAAATAATTAFAGVVSQRDQLKERVQYLEAKNEELTTQLHQINQMRKESEKAAQIPAVAARGNVVDVKREVKKEEDDDDASGGCSTTAAVAGPTSCRKRRGTEESDDCVIVWSKAGKVKKLQQMTSSRAACGSTSSPILTPHVVKKEEPKE